MIFSEDRNNYRINTNLKHIKNRIEHSHVLRSNITSLQKCEKNNVTICPKYGQRKTYLSLYSIKGNIYPLIEYLYNMIRWFRIYKTSTHTFFIKHT